jgi:hypothetical protein
MYKILIVLTWNVPTEPKVTVNLYLKRSNYLILGTVAYVACMVTNLPFLKQSNVIVSLKKACLATLQIYSSSVVGAQWLFGSLCTS